MKQIVKFLFLGIFLFSACNSPKPPTFTETENSRKLISSYNRTAVDLYRQLKSSQGNLVISPYSINTVLTMAMVGSDGETRKEMAQVMHQTMADPEINQAAGKLNQYLAAYANYENITLESANALCLTTHGDLVTQKYKDILTENYGAELFTAQDVQPINTWVNKKTHGKISQIIDQLSPVSVCVLLNAVYFKGLWEKQFDKRDTKDAQFTCSDKKTIMVPMMGQSEEFKMVHNDDFDALSMPFKGKSIHMVILLPGKNDLAALEKKLTYDQIDDVLQKIKKSYPKKTPIRIPRFKIEFSTDLKSPFTALGMTKPFSKLQANFGILSGKPEEKGFMFITQFKHKAFIEVNEEGSEAAAVTSATIHK